MKAGRVGNGGCKADYAWIVRVIMPVMTFVGVLILANTPLFSVLYRQICR